LATGYWLLANCLALTLVSCAPQRQVEVPANTPVPGRVTVVDYSPKFLAFYDTASAATLDPNARWALWKRLYGFAAVPPTPFGDSLARRLLDSAWTRYPMALPRIRQGAAALGISPEAELQRVITLLGCGEQTRVRLIVFVGGFEENAFAFTSRDGLPTVAIPLEAGDAARSLLHEFTHTVHRSSGCADIRSGYEQSLAELLLSEGVAMRTVEALLPGRPASYYLTASPEWLDTADVRRTAILRGIREHLSDAGAETARRFTFGGGTTGLLREGYYAGWEVTGALLRSGVSLHEIATTPPARIPALIRRGLNALAASP
jgi:hypothetical protein